jgi:hypothetical protein
MAYLTRAILEQESTWYFTAWQPQIGSQAAFDTWIDSIVTRVANHTKWRVGAALYGTSDPLVQEVLKEAELCLAQYYLLLAQASISDTSDNSAQQPAIAGGRALVADARAYKERYDEILSPYDTKLARSRWARPASATTTDTQASLPDFAAPVDWEAAG